MNTRRGAVRSRKGDVDAVLAALADPQRRKVVDVLRGGPRSPSRRRSNSIPIFRTLTNCAAFSPNARTTTHWPEEAFAQA
ncbi:MAG: hypothetical protein HC794_04035, partial [Nitrospiraceae bacterium]|nr:hypothetical protein [Nitrospiraceae bacterium]